MTLLLGITAPAGDGPILEVHVDLWETHSPLEWLGDFGFENDPFAVFYPSGYVHHVTGRTRVHEKGLRAKMSEVDALIERVIDEARSRRVDLYTEVELVRDTKHFPQRSIRGINVLDKFTFTPTGKCGGAKADIHIEFLAGTVPAEVREYLLRKYFYWVSTPETKYFPAEEIATLQTATYGSAQDAYKCLVVQPLPLCTGIHLEQKLSMRATRPDLPMPEVIKVLRQL